ncbi:MAG: hypothetical protein ABL917_03740 [Parcubacteria group bacterium]
MMITNLTTGEVFFNKYPAPGDESLKAYDEYNSLKASYGMPLVN